MSQSPPDRRRGQPHGRSGYREGVRRHVESGESQPAAEEAQHAVEGVEAEELRKAEERAKARGKTR
jgi:hypothetical protein